MLMWKLGADVRYILKWMKPGPENGSPVHGLKSANVNGTCVSTEGGSSAASSGADSDFASGSSHATAVSSTTRTPHRPECKGSLERNVGNCGDLLVAGTSNQNLNFNIVASLLQGRCR